MHPVLRTTTALLIGSLLAATLFWVASPATAAPEQPAGLADLRLNELMASNSSTLFDPDDPDRTPDWIELYNPTGSPVSLTGLALTDDPARPTKHVITASLTISAYSFLVLFADNDPQRGPLHLDFSLSAGGEYVGIYAVQSNDSVIKIDEVEFGPQQSDISYARSLDGTGNWRPGRPTAGKSNSVNPPYISNVTSPTLTVDLPGPTGPFTVSATITDDVGVAVAQIRYITQTAPYTGPLSWTTLPMVQIGPTQYAAALPAMPTGTLVRYYVEASDGQAESTRFPLLGRDYGYLAGYTAPRVLIHKVVSRNDYVPDPDEPAERPDWVELYNPGTAAVSLDGLSITNDRNEPLKFRIPAGVTLAPGQLLAFLADSDIGQNTLPNRSVWHMNFTLENANDFVGLYGGEGTAIIDGFDWDERPRFGGFGRVPTGGTWTDLICVVALEEPNLPCDQQIYLPTVSR